MKTYILTIKAETPPAVLVGDELLTGKLVAVELGEPEIVSVSQLVKITGLSPQTIREKLRPINLGDKGKARYDLDNALELLKFKENKTGKKRKN